MIGRTALARGMSFPDLPVTAQPTTSPKVFHGAEWSRPTLGTGTEDLCGNESRIDIGN